jgi:hypothetical protein
MTPDAWLTPSRLRFVVAALGLAAIALNAPLVDWGVPHATAPDRIKTWATDEILPLEGLAEMRSTFVADAPDRNFGYPWWHYFVVAAAQTPYLGILRLTGGLTQPSATYPYGLRDPVGSLEMLTIVGRLVSVLMGAGIVIASFFFARALWGDSAGVAAGLLTSVSYPTAYYSRTGNLDVPAFFWSAIALAVLATMFARGLTTRRAAVFAAFAALGAATKDQAVALFVPLCFILAVPQVNHRPGQRYQWAPLIVGVITGLGVYVLATGMLFDPRRHIAHLAALLSMSHRVTNAAAYFPPAPAGWSGTLTLASEYVRGFMSMMSLPVMLAGAAGFVLAIRRSAWHLVWLLPFLMTFVLFVRIPGIVVLRYLLPLTLFVDAFAALALVRLRDSKIRAAFVPLLVLLLTVRLLAVVDLSHAQRHDTRYAAADWLRAHYRAGERIEYFGVTETLPPLDAGVDVRRIMGRQHWVGEFGHGPKVLDYLRSTGPTYVIVIPDWTSRAGMPHSADCPPEVFAALVDGSAGYSLAAEFLPPRLVPLPFARPALDNPSVAPPVRIFARAGSPETPQP